MRARSGTLVAVVSVAVVLSNLPATEGQAGLVLDVQLEQVASGLTRPLFVTHADDGSGRLFIVEQGGTVRVLSGGALDPVPYLNVASKVRCCGERGLLGLAFHPDFPTNGKLFISYSRAGDGASVLEKLTVASPPGGAPPTSGEVLLVVAQPFSNHNGGWIGFGPDGYLYLALGDGGSAGDPGNRAQNLEVLLGKMLRLDVDVPAGYAIPPDNPFVGSPGMDEIWAYGLRNPWRNSFDRNTGDLWIADVGQNLNEEVNRQPAASNGGENYGWRAWEGHLPFSVGQALSPASAGMIFPVAEYAHAPHCSITGGYVYRGTSVAALAGRYLYGDYCSGYVWMLEPAGGTYVPVQLLDTPYQITSFGEDEAGELYLTHHATNLPGQGAVYQVV